MPASTPECKVGWVPYPEGSVLPATAGDAFEDAIRYLGTLTPRATVRDWVRATDSKRIVEAAQGMVTDRHLNPAELCLGATLDYCIKKGLLQSPAFAIGAIESLKQEVLEGGVFIGQERTSVPTLLPQ